MQQDVNRPDRCEEGFDALESPFVPAAGTDTAEQTTPGRFIITDDPEIRSGELNSTIAALAREGLAVMRVCNPLTAPLTAQRIVIQLDFDNSDDNESEDGDETYLGHILQRLVACGRLALIIEQAETLDIAALRTLWLTGVHNESVVIVFVGTAGFWPLLRQADLAPHHNDLMVQGRRSEEITNAAKDEQRTSASSSSPPALPFVEGVTLRQPNVTITPTRPSWNWRLYTGFLLTLVLGAGVAANRFFYSVTPQVTVTEDGTSSDNVSTAQPSVTDPQSIPSPTEGSSGLSTQQVKAPAVFAPPSLESSPKMSEGGPEKVITPGTPDGTPPAGLLPAPSQLSHQEKLRAQFDEFLAQSAPETAALSETQRSTLFREYLASRSGGTAPRQTIPPHAQGRIVIHYREGGLPLRERLKMAAAASFAGAVETRAVPASPSIPEIRFFHAADEVQARKLAETLRGLQPRWEVRDFRTFRPSPSSGTIEVWIPSH